MTGAVEPLPEAPSPTPIRAPDAAGIAEAVTVLREGRLVGLPTETVYGLAGNARDASAVHRIYATKVRPPDNPLIVHVPSLRAAEGLVAQVTPLARALASSYWPGPLTMVLDSSDRVPAITRAGLSTVALRVPDHPVALTLLATSGLPLAAPSANRSGRPSPTRPEHVVAEFDADVEVVLDGGQCVIGLESTVVDARGSRPIVLRDGAVTREVLGVPASTLAPEQHRSPGTRHAHYAPDCPVEIAVDPSHALELATNLIAAGQRVGLVAPEEVLAEVRARLGGRSASGVLLEHRVQDELELARELYGVFRAAEQAGTDRLVVLAIEERGVGRAVMDRLRRAAAGR